MACNILNYCRVTRPWAQHDQPIDWIEPNSTSRLAQVEAKVECWTRKTTRSTRALSHQDPFLMWHGSQPAANRPPHLVAFYDTQGGAEDVFYPEVPTGLPFQADLSAKMATLASDWPTHFFLFNRCTNFNRTWQEASTLTIFSFQAIKSTKTPVRARGLSR